jgi:hypothetical protein
MSFAFPYRQLTPLWFNNVKVTIQEGSGELILSKQFADYIIELRRIAKENNFLPETPILDFSGLFPGTLYALNSYTPKNAWIVTAKNDRTKYVSYVFSTIPCEEITRSWILYENPFDVLPINLLVLEESGINLNTDYSLIGIVKYPRILNPNKGILMTEHYLFKPIKDYNEAVVSCYKARDLSQKTKMSP